MHFGSSTIGRSGMIVVDCSDPERLAAFWYEVLGVGIKSRRAGGKILLQPQARRTLFRDVEATTQAIAIGLDEHLGEGCVEGAEEGSRRRLGRRLTAGTRERALRRYPGDA